MRLLPIALFTVLVLVLGPAHALRAATTVERGDTLSVTVAEAPEISRTVLVDPDGRIMLAALGGVAVAGLDLDRVREEIARELTVRNLIRNPTVLVEFAAWRPFYVGGAVARPGAFAYAPGLTVRQALVTAGGLAGGLAARADPLAGTGSAAGELLAEARATAYRLLQIDARIARLRAELPHTDDVAGPAVDPLQVPPDDAEAIVELERALRLDRDERRQAEHGHLENVLDLVALEISVLEQQAALQIEEQKQQKTELAAARSLFAKGLIANARLSEMIRDGSRLARDILENRSFAARARQEEATTRYQIAAAETEWRIAVRNELAAALAERATLTAQAEVLNARLMASGLALGRAGGLAAPEATVTIHRIEAGRSASITAGLEAEVRPGDVLDVALVPAPEG